MPGHAQARPSTVVLRLSRGCVVECSTSGQRDALSPRGEAISEPRTGQALAPVVPLAPTSPVPLYFEVASRLQQLIESGEMPVGSRLVNEIELADRLGVSRPTMRKAIAYLVERGLLVRERGVGTQIVQPKVRRPVELSSLYDDLAKGGQDPSSVVRLLEVRAAPDHVADALGCAQGIEVTWIEHLRHAGGEPLAIMRNAVPTDVLPPTAAELERHGLYELLRAAGHVPRAAHQTIGARGEHRGGAPAR